MKKVGSLSSIRRAGSLKSTKMSRQDSESENEEGLLSQTQSRDTVTDIGMPMKRVTPGEIYYDIKRENSRDMKVC